MTSTQYQNHLFGEFKTRSKDVRYEWRAFDNGPKTRYAPKVDIAVGPFNTAVLTKEQRHPYRQKFRDNSRFKRFVERCYEHHINNMNIVLQSDARPASIAEMLEANTNTRCLIALEIENMNSRKHMMGSIVNSASLGYIGIGIGCYFLPSRFR